MGPETRGPETRGQSTWLEVSDALLVAAMAFERLGYFQTVRFGPETHVTSNHPKKCSVPRLLSPPAPVPRLLQVEWQGSDDPLLSSDESSPSRFDWENDVDLVDWQAYLGEL